MLIVLSKLTRKMEYSDGLWPLYKVEEPYARLPEKRRLKEGYCEKNVKNVLDGQNQHEYN